MNIQEDLKAYVDGELTQSAAEEVRRELDSNDSLRNEAALLRILGQEIRELAVEPVVVGAEKALERPRRRRLLEMPTWAFCALLAFLILPGGTLFFLYPVFGQAKMAAKSASPGRVAMKAMFANRAGAPEGAATAPPAMPAESEGSDDFVAAPEAKSAAQSVEMMKRVPTEVAPENSVVGSIPVPGPLTGDVASNTATITKNLKSFQPKTRMKVQEGSVDVLVDDVAKAESDCSDFVAHEDGVIDSSSVQQDPGSTPVAHLDVRVPSGNFLAVMDHVKALAKTSGDLVSFRTSSNDVTTPFVNKVSELNTQGANEDQQVALMQRTRNAGGRAAIRNQVLETRNAIENARAQAGALKAETDMAKITIDIAQQTAPATPDKPSNWAADSWSVAMDGLTAAGRFLGMVMIYLFVLCPIWIPLLTFGWVLARRR